MGTSLKSDMQDSQSSGAFLSLIRTIIRNWKFLLIIHVIVGVIAVIILLLMEPWYRSTATVVIQTPQQGGILASIANSLPIGLNLNNQNNAQYYIAFINTRRMLDSVNNKFHMQQVYGYEYKDQVYDALRNNLHTIDQENGTFSISFDYENDPKKAAEIVNYVYNVLYDLVLEVNRTQASDYRSYIGNYYKETMEKLDNSRHQLAAFQKQTGLYSLQDQLPVLINTIATLEAQKMQYQIQMNYLKRIKQNDGLSLGAIQTQINSINSQINELKHSNRYSNVAMDTLPNLAIRYYELYQGVAVGEKVTEFLRLQYEQALLDQQKKSANIYLLDPAKPADRKFKPKRSADLKLVLALTYIFSVIY